MRNSGWLLGGQTVARGLTLAQGVMLARALGIEHYGVLVLVTTYVLAVLQFFDFRGFEFV